MVIMKKFFLFLAIAATVAMTFSSCKPDDEIYNPKCKISKIWYYSNSDWENPDVRFVYGKKGVLDSIRLKGGASFLFEYNKDKTVSKIVSDDSLCVEVIELSYTDRLVDKIVYSVDGQVRKEITFKRDAETTRITDIEEIYDKEFYEGLIYQKKSRLYNTFLGDADQAHEWIQRVPTKDLTVRCTKKVKYDPGKKEKYLNIAEVVEYFPNLNQEIVHTYTYDLETYNPYYGLQYAYADLSGYYVNNVKKETQTVKTNGMQTKYVEYTYDYSGLNFINNKKYPRQFTKTSSENNIPRNIYILYVK
jgi:hypothetical protein